MGFPSWPANHLICIKHRAEGGLEPALYHGGSEDDQDGSPLAPWLGASGSPPALTWGMGLPDSSLGELAKQPYHHASCTAPSHNELDECSYVPTASFHVS